MDAKTLFLWLLILPFAGAILTYLVGRVAVIRKVKNNPARWLAFIVFVMADYIFITLAQQFLVTGPIDLVYGTVALQFDGISLVLGGSALLLGTLASFFSIDYIAGDIGEEKFYAMVISMVAAVVGLSCANDLFNLWIWFEIMAITSYMLVAFYSTQPGSLEAGVKYLVQSATGSILVLLGIALVFMVTGETNLDTIQKTTAASSMILLAAGALFIIGFGVKAALVPMHTWLPDAHSQAPSGVSALLSGIVIEAGLIAMLRALGALTHISLSWGIILLIFGALNMTYGNLMALRQNQVKRLLAFSSLSHVGYMLIGFGTAIQFHVLDGAAGGFFHLITHTMMKGLAFLAAGALLYALYIARQKHGPLMLEDLNGASHKYPMVALGFSVAVLGLGGLPPLAGFMSKWQIFVGGFETHNTWMILLVVYAALNSVVSLGYYAPMVNHMYRLEPSAIVTEGKELGFLIQIPLVLLTSAIVALGLWPSAISFITTTAAAALLKGFGG
ncbi:MAG TPA: proton-conducting transporter membrane subunit [Leptolinea sp.]